MKESYNSPPTQNLNVRRQLQKTWI